MGVYIKDASGKRIKVAGGGSGAVGPSGQDGKSAYDYAVAGGYTGTEAAFQALMGSAPHPIQIFWTTGTSRTPSTSEESSRG